MNRFLDRVKKASIRRDFLLSVFNTAKGILPKKKDEPEVLQGEPTTEETNSEVDSPEDRDASLPKPSGQG